MLLSAEHISKNYGTKQLLHDVTLYLEEGQKIGIIGVNGTGKSTLLKILAGAEEPDEGTLARDPNVQISYLPQNPEMQDDATVLEQVFLHHPPEFRALKEYESKTILTRLGEKGFVTAERAGRRRVYLPLVTRSDYLAAQSGAFFRGLCGGSVSTFAAALCDSGLSREELEQLRDLLERDAL